MPRSWGQCNVVGGEVRAKGVVENKGRASSGAGYLKNKVFLFVLDAMGG